jgi:hypothetical protein
MYWKHGIGSNTTRPPPELASTVDTADWVRAVMEIAQALLSELFVRSIPCRQQRPISPNPERLTAWPHAVLVD